jgi:hypothetical protein
MSQHKYVKVWMIVVHARTVHWIPIKLYWNPIIKVWMIVAHAHTLHWIPIKLYWNPIIIYYQMENAK